MKGETYNPIPVALSVEEWRIVQHSLERTGACELADKVRLLAYGWKDSQ